MDEDKILECELHGDTRFIPTYNADGLNGYMCRTCLDEAYRALNAGDSIPRFACTYAIEAMNVVWASVVKPVRVRIAGEHHG